MQKRCDDLGLGLLSLTSGCVDVLGFTKLGGVFTSAMTGNTALLAVAIGQGHLVAASRSLCALAGFVAGVVLASAVMWRLERRSDAHLALACVLVLELALLAACAVLWSTSPHGLDGTPLYTVIALSALGMGVQAVGARSVNSTGINTIVFTSSLIQIAGSWIGKSRRGADPGTQSAPNGHLRTFIAYGCGAVAMAILVAHDVRSSMWVPVATAALALVSTSLGRSVESKPA